MKTCTVGSTWKKCDLHFHTPISFDHHFKNQTTQETVEKLTSNNVTLVAVTDHYFIDADYIQALRDASFDRITFLPGVEVRTDLGDSAVHMIGIFSEETDINKLSNEFCAFTKIYKDDLRNKQKLETTYTPHADFINFINEHGGLCSLHAGCGRSGSFETIGNKDWCQRTLKTDLLKSNICLLDVTKEKHISDYKDIVFQSTGVCCPIISGSDNHDIRTYELKLPCWLKCDPTFKGLLQVTNEPEDRIFLGKCPPVLHHIQMSPAKYIQSVRIDKKSDSKLPSTWFSNCFLPLNSGLVSIIGNKGNGKSALADIIALLSNSHHKEESFSFLNKQKFRHKKNGKASHFYAQIKWESGEESKQLDLDNEPNLLAPERAKYIPQRFLEELCNEYDGKEAFQKELQKVIFSYIPESEKLGNNNLDELIKYVTNETLDSIAETRNRLSKLNKIISELEFESSNSYKKQLENKFNLKFDEYKNALLRKPSLIKNPNDDPEQQNIASTLLATIDRSKTDRDTLEKCNNESKSQLRQCNIKLAKIHKLMARIGNLQQHVDTFKSESTEFEDLGLSIHNIVIFDVNFDPLNYLKDKEIRLEQNLKQKTDASLDGSIANQLLLKTQELEVLTSRLSEPERNYQNYIRDLSEWKRQLKTLAGDPNTPGTLKFLHKEILKSTSIPVQLEKLYIERKNILKEIYSKKVSLKDKYIHYYAPVESFIKNHKLVQQQQIRLEFTVSITQQDFSDHFLSLVDQGRSGAFYGKDAGKNKLEESLAKKDFNIADDSIGFAEEITSLLKYDDRTKTLRENLTMQFVKGISPSEVYDYIFSFDYLQPIYSLNWAGKGLEQLSPGERGNLLLIFYLLIDQEQIPLILDQPEDNLDNHTVYKTLVPCIRDAKKRRQIIMVTHNPNLAVVCDSEQIIYTEIKKELDSEVCFSSGSLENTAINKRVVDVLEGTRPAFDKRESKYIL